MQHMMSFNRLSQSLVLPLFKMSASGLFLKYSSHFANLNLDILIKSILIKKKSEHSLNTCLAFQILCTTQTREDHLDVEDTNDLPETLPSVPSSVSPKTATPPRQVEKPLSPPGVFDCSPVHSPKPHSPRRHLTFSPLINIQSPSPRRDGIITRRDLTKLVSNIYFSRYGIFR